MVTEEYKGFKIVEAPGQMFKAIKKIPSGHFNRPIHACTVRSLKTSIDYALSKLKPVNRNKSEKN